MVKSSRIDDSPSRSKFDTHLLEVQAKSALLRLQRMRKVGDNVQKFIRNKHDRRWRVRKIPVLHLDVPFHDVPGLRNAMSYYKLHRAVELNPGHAVNCTHINDSEILQKQSLVYEITYALIKSKYDRAITTPYNQDWIKMLPIKGYPMVREAIALQFRQWLKGKLTEISAMLQFKADEAKVGRRHSDAALDTELRRVRKYVEVMKIVMRRVGPPHLRKQINALHSSAAMNYYIKVPPIEMIAMLLGIVTRPVKANTGPITKGLERVNRVFLTHRSNGVHWACCDFTDHPRPPFMPKIRFDPTESLDDQVWVRVDLQEPNWLKAYGYPMNLIELCTMCHFDFNSAVRTLGFKDPPVKYKDPE